MLKQMTDKQLAANRRNARRSTGPKTPTGKARSSRNALKHGLLAKDVVLADGPLAESLADFHDLLADFHRQLKPQGPVQKTIVERLAVSYWRLLRAQRYEVRAQRAAVGGALPPDADPPAIEKLTRQLQEAQADLHRDETLLEMLHQPPDPADPKAQADFQDLVRQTLQSFDDDLPDHPESEWHETVVDQLQESAQECRVRVTKRREQLADAQRRAELHTARAAADAALPDQPTMTRLVRYESMLDRHFHRALHELRNWQTKSSRSRPLPTRNRKKNSRKRTHSPARGT